MSKSKVYFKANAAVKDIVGRGLIYDDNVAIIELIKNARDANAEVATIQFENEDSTSTNSAITIKDNGKGMSFDDIVNKWLNIAYSEKKGVLFKNRSAYAGNKGVGRFSCDRLGSQLTLYTKSEDGDYLKLHIDWELFENKKQDDEISTIELNCEIVEEDVFLSETGVTKFKNGTILKIANLRSEWTSRKLKKLIAELEKFSPTLDDKFEVFIFSSTEHDDPLLQAKLNKKIDNNIFEKLAFKTTYIKSKIDSAGETITTTLFYQGDELYKYLARNPYPNLKNISVEVHYLDTLSKSYFTKHTGITPNDYGSIFLFYNNFRISPYGNDKNDWLSLDRRKSQGTARYLGTREVFGRIDITDVDNTFSVVTSREGLAQNKAFAELVAFDHDEKTTLNNGKESYGFATTIIRQLENFVVSGLDWNRLIDRLAPKDTKRVVNITDVQRDPGRYQLKTISAEQVKEACDRILKSDWEVTGFEINDNLILKISDIADEKYKQFVDDFVEKTKSKSFKDLSSREKGVIKKIVGEEQAKTQAAVEERNYAEVKRDEAEQKVETEKRRSSFLETLASPEKTLDALITHVMKQISGGIEKDIKSILSIYYKSPERVSKEDLVKVLEDVVLDITTIKESSTMATKADFNLKVSNIKDDLFAFLADYIRVIVSRDKKWGLNLTYSNPENLTHNRTFKPSDIGIMLVNILDNSRKADAKNVVVECTEAGISFTDDGHGFDLEKYSTDELLQKGISTTSGGSGLGLYHCAILANSIGAIIKLSNSQKTGGAVVTLEFHNEN